MKPPYLNKLSKKQLKKQYTIQWREAIRANGEIYLGNIQNDQLHEVILQQEQEINIKSIALTEHFWKIEELKQDLEDTLEALSRSRQLRWSLQELADRKHRENANIEDMARNLYEFANQHEAWAFDLLKKWHYINNPTLKLRPAPWENLSDERKDHFLAHATHIISHLPTDEKWKTTTEGSPE